MEESCTTSQDHQEELQRELYGAECTLQDLVNSHQLVEASLRANKFVYLFLKLIVYTTINLLQNKI
jgi:hypothetical protein